MKIDKKSALHWVYLMSTGILAVLALITRPLKRFRKTPLVVLYGHKLNGNLKAFYDFCKKKDDLPFDIVYLTMDPTYYKELKEEGVDVKIAYSPIHMLHVAQSEAMITSHGYHSLFIYYRFTNMKFIDVRHGIPYKGYTAEDFADKLGYDQEWLSSGYFKKLYVEEYGFQEEQIKVTGFARVDRLVLGDYDREKLLKKYGISGRKNVLLAPTWAQDEKGRSILPFGATMEEFFEGLDTTGRKMNANIIFRAHLNSGDPVSANKYEYVKVMPYTEHPVVEEFLYIADVLITDWSSIAIDYLALGRPAIFLDVPAPFSNGFTLGPEHRYGKVVKSVEELSASIEKYLEYPEKFHDEHNDSIENTKLAAYGDTLDGKARERYLINLKELLR